MSIDSTCTQLSNINSRLMKHTGVDLVAIPTSWEEVTRKNISASAGIASQYFLIYLSLMITETRDWSQKFRSDVENLIRTPCTDSPDRLKGSIQDKGPPLKVAQTRLIMRTQRTRRF